MALSTVVTAASVHQPVPQGLVRRSGYWTLPLPMPQLGLAGCSLAFLLVHCFLDFP